MSIIFLLKCDWLPLSSLLRSKLSIIFSCAALQSLTINRCCIQSMSSFIAKISSQRYQHSEFYATCCTWLSATSGYCRHFFFYLKGCTPHNYSIFPTIYPFFMIPYCFGTSNLNIAFFCPQRFLSIRCFYQTAHYISQMFNLLQTILKPIISQIVLYVSNKK